MLLFLSILLLIEQEEIDTSTKALVFVVSTALSSYPVFPFTKLVQVLRALNWVK